MASLTANLLNTINANGALGALFSTPNSFGNPEALAQTAQAVLAFQNQFPPQQVLALSGLFTQLSSLASAALPLQSFNPQANSLLLQTNSPVLAPNFYQQNSVASSNFGSVSATSRPGATIASYQVGVNQLAVSQVNTGTAFTSATIQNAGGGVNITATPGTLQVTINGVSAQASYTVGATVTNQVALTSVASAINSITANNDIQTVTLNGASSGTFTLSFGGQTTGALAFNASAATVKAALGGLSSVGGAANVNVGLSGTTYTIAFVGTQANKPLGTLAATNSALNAGASLSTAVIGPAATVSNASGNSTLVVTAGAPGTANAFTVSDVAGNGITQSGAATTTTAAQDAIYTLNGSIYRATGANTTTIDNGKVSLGFSATTATPATITVSPNTSALTAAVTNLATAYDNLQTYLTNNSAFITPQLAQQAQNVITANAASLANVGITGNTSLAINQTTLAAASPSAIQAAFGSLTGMATQLGQLTSSLLPNSEAPLAAAPQTQANNSQLATGLASVFEQLLFTGQGLGANVSVRA